MRRGHSPARRRRRAPATAHPASMFSISEKEQGVAAWAFRFGKAAGRFTDNLPSAEAIYIPMATNRGPVGVIAVELPGEQPPTLEQRDLLDAFARQAALVLDRFRLDAEAATGAAAGGIGETEQGAAQLHFARAAHPHFRHHRRRQRPGRIPARRAARPAKDPRRRNPGKRRPPQPPGGQFAGHDPPGVRQGQAAPGMVRRGRPGQRRPAPQRNRTGPAPGQVQLSRRRCPWCGWISSSSSRPSTISSSTPPLTPRKGRRWRSPRRAASGEVSLTVADRGPGLPPESLPHVFEKFYRVPGAPAGRDRPGLVHCQRICGSARRAGRGAQPRRAAARSSPFICRWKAAPNPARSQSHER